MATCVRASKSAQRRPVTSDYVTIDDAERLLPRVRPLLESARKLKREIETIAARYNYEEALLEVERPRIESLARRLNDKIEKLEEYGCYVRDLDIGVVDFLTKFEGRDVFLSWRLGEQRVAHWHELHEGYGQRQPVIDLCQLELETEFVVPIVENEN